MDTPRPSPFARTAAAAAPFRNPPLEHQLRTFAVATSFLARDGSPLPDAGIHWAAPLPQRPAAPEISQQEADALGMSVARAMHLLRRTRLTKQELLDTMLGAPGDDDGGESDPDESDDDDDDDPPNLDPADSDTPAETSAAEATEDVTIPHKRPAPALPSKSPAPPAAPPRAAAPPPAATTDKGAQTTPTFPRTPTFRPHDRVYTTLRAPTPPPPPPPTLTSAVLNGVVAAGRISGAALGRLAMRGVGRLDWALVSEDTRGSVDVVDAEEGWGVVGEAGGVRGMVSRGTGTGTVGAAEQVRDVGWRVVRAGWRRGPWGGV